MTAGAAQHPTGRKRNSGVVRQVLSGVGYLARGSRLWLTSPRLMLFGAIPAFIVGVAYLAVVVLVAFSLDSIASWATPFADGWVEGARSAVRFAAKLALIGAVLLVAVSTFAAVTLAVGDPFYERIWREVEERLGDAPTAIEEPWWRSTLRGAGTGIRLLLLTASIGVVLFACGFIPVVGQTVVPVLAALFGGWFLALDLSGFAFDSRRSSLRMRRRMLGASRARTLGFGVATYLLFLVPLAAVVVMPAAVAGATMLSRDALEEARARAGAPGSTPTPL